MSFSTRLVVLVSAAMALGAALPATAQEVAKSESATPTAGVIFACYNYSNGLVTIVNRPSDCSPTKQRAFSWNSRGPEGPTGSKGATGARGLTGPAGAQGLTGPAGPAGPIGLTGAAGAQGLIGPAGPAGPIGLTGATGAQGLTGPTGPAGPIGPTGAVGAQGLIGLTGPAGPTGAAGPQGLTGPAGPIGLTGAAGAQGPIGPTGPSGAQGPAGPAGPQGPAGPAGETGATGAAGPGGGQVWSANMLLPESIPAIDNILGAMSGVSIGAVQGPSALQAAVLPVPQNCTASNFKVTVVGASGTSNAVAGIGFSTSTDFGEGNLDGLALLCTVTANSGATVTCSSSSTADLTTSQFVSLFLGDFTNSADFQNTRMYASFVCQ